MVQEVEEEVIQVLLEEQEIAHRQVLHKVIQEELVELEDQMVVEVVEQVQLEMIQEVELVELVEQVQQI